MFYCHSCYFLINFDLLNTHLDFWYNVIVNLVNVKMCKFSTNFFNLEGGIYFFLGTLLGQFLISGLMLATDEGFRIFKLFSFETRTIKRPVCFLRTHHYWEISTAVVLKPDSLNWKHLKTEIHNESCHGSVHPNTEFFSQGILSISLLAGLLSGSVEAGCDESWAIQSSDPHLQLSRGHQNKLRASCAAWARRWSLDLGTGDTSPAQWRQPPDQGSVQSHDAGLSLVTGGSTGLWLADGVTPVPVSPWSQMRGDRPEMRCSQR